MREEGFQRAERIDKILFLQELLELVEKNGRFDFIGWCNNFDLSKPLEKTTRFNKPMILLRRN